MPSYIENRDKNNTRDKLSSGPATTGDFATSTSSNLTTATEGAYDDPNELFPHNNISSNNKKAELAYNFFNHSR
ncbi:MAG TPA: hypothetical protein DGK91_14780 [Clostridium sp.]|jgi:hypothetical protein|nr:hypothetical protein [Clostridia bacterium]HCW05660.1 hypothetical protein [Clostridium sp.]